MTHICTHCIKLKECNWKCLPQCKKEKEDEHYNREAEKEEAISMYENGKAQS